MADSEGGAIDENNPNSSNNEQILDSHIVSNQAPSDSKEIDLSAVESTVAESSVNSCVDTSATTESALTGNSLVLGSSTEISSTESAEHTLATAAIVAKTESIDSGTEVVSSDINDKQASNIFTENTISESANLVNDTLNVNNKSKSLTDELTATTSDSSLSSPSSVNSSDINSAEIIESTVVNRTNLNNNSKGAVNGAKSMETEVHPSTTIPETNYISSILSSISSGIQTSGQSSHKAEEWPAPVVTLGGMRSNTSSQSDVSSPVRVTDQVGSPKSSGNTTASGLLRQKKDRMATERANLLSICRLVVKELIDISMREGRFLDEDHDPLLQFLIVMEHIMLHGIKVRRSGLLRDKQDIWMMLEHLGRYSPAAAEICLSIRDMSNVRSSLGRVRAWLRLSLMQKSLADYFRILIDNREQLLVPHYEPSAVMLTEDAMVISGLLVGINVIDCNIALKDSDLDLPLGIIDYSLYLKEIIQNPEEVGGGEGEGVQQREGSDDISDDLRSKLSTILDQKNYLEELNRRLTGTVAGLNQKLDAMQASHQLSQAEVSNARDSMTQLQRENSLLRCENSALLEGHQRQLETARQDIQIERDTYQQSRQGLDILYQEAKKKLHDETQMRLDVEKELQLQISMKQEIEVGIHMLEKDVQDKQDLIVSLRKQLEEVKSINIDVFTKSQSSESALQHKTDMVNRLEIKCGQMVSTIRDMEDEVQRCAESKRTADEMARKLAQQMTEKDQKRAALETDLKVEREWRATLQKNLEQEKANSAKLSSELKIQASVRKDYDSLQRKYMQLQQMCEDQEKALAELGSHLSQSKLKMEDYKEAQQQFKDATWAEDKEVTECKQCTKPFSVSRRKHHCRHCGEIFCNDCSNTKMPLPSSAKPVRVCDTCNNILLQRYSVNQ